MTDTVRTTILIPGDLHERLKMTALHHRRSVHAQMLALIEAGVGLDERKYGLTEREPVPEDVISAAVQAVLRNPDIMAALAEESDRAEPRRRA